MPENDGRHDPRRSAWLTGLPDDLRARFLADAIQRTCAEDTVIWRFGDPIDGMYGIVEGSVRIETVWSSHGPSMLNIFHAGSWLGEAEFLSGSNRITSLTTLTPCRFLFVRRAVVESLTLTRPEIWRGIGLLAFEHLSLAIAALDDLMIRRSDARLAAVLLRLTGGRIGVGGEGTSRELHVTQTELSRMANLSRSVVGRMLRRFERERIVGRSYGRLEVLDPEALRKAAGVDP